MPDTEDNSKATNASEPPIFGVSTDLDTIVTQTSEPFTPGFPMGLIATIDTSAHDGTSSTFIGFMKSFDARIRKLESMLTTPEGLDALTEEIEKRLVERLGRRGMPR